MRGATNGYVQPVGIAWISTHTPHAGRDILFGISTVSPSTFLLTRPMRGATDIVIYTGYYPYDFYSHAPCGARQSTQRHLNYMQQFLLTRPMRGATNYGMYVVVDMDISTHTPHAGRDEFTTGENSLNWDFYSHAPCGARPW